MTFLNYLTLIAHAGFEQSGYIRPILFFSSTSFLMFFSTTAWSYPPADAFLIISVRIRQPMRSDLGSPLICPRPVISCFKPGLNLAEWFLNAFERLSACYWEGTRVLANLLSGTSSCAQITGPSNLSGQAKLSSLQSCKFILMTWSLDS